jgi:predicted lipoprotein with Yx(FWY)xxD motif
MKRPLASAFAPAIVTALVLAACGSSSSNSSSTQSGASSPQSSGTQSSASAAPATAGRAVTVTTKHDKLGTVLAAGSKQLTVYLFEADKGDKSRCMGACASAWPPVLGKPKGISQARSSDLSTITRPDGRTQVTYNGHPLYYFVKDKDAEDAYGEGVDAFGAGWYALSPSGSKIDNDESDKKKVNS